METRVVGFPAGVEALCSSRLLLQVLLVQPDVPDLEDLRAPAAGHEEQVYESRELRCKAKDATGLEVLVNLRGFSKDQISDADHCPGVQAAEHFVGVVERVEAAAGTGPGGTCSLCLSCEAQGPEPPAAGLVTVAGTAPTCPERETEAGLRSETPSALAEGQMSEGLA